MYKLNFTSTLFAGALLSMILSSGLVFLVSFVVLTTTNSALNTGLLLAIHILGVALFSAVGGWLADSKPHLALVCGQIVSALAILAFSLYLKESPVTLASGAAFSLLIGIGKSLSSAIFFKIPAQNQSQSQMGMMNLASRIGNIFGPALGALFLTCSLQIILVLSVVLFLISALLCVSYLNVGRIADFSSTYCVNEKPSARLKISKEVTTLIVVFSTINFLLMPMGLFIEIWMKDFAIIDQRIAVYLQFSISVGLLLGSVFPNFFPKTKNALHLKHFRGSLIISAVSILFLAIFEKQPYILGIFLFLIGFFTSVASLYLLLQTSTLVEKNQQGRIFGIINGSLTAAGAFGFVMFGFLMDQASTQILLFVCSLSIFCLTFLYHEKATQTL